STPCASTPCASTPCGHPPVASPRKSHERPASGRPYSEDEERHMRMARVVTAALLVPTIALGLGACSSKKKTATLTSSGKATVEAYDFRFDPTTLTAKAGQAVTITFKNEGT